MDRAHITNLSDITGKLVLSTEEILPLLTRILEYLEDQATPHGDIKPRSITLNSEGHPALAMPGTTEGTPYLAPEIAEGGDATDATDLWAVGAIAFELLSGMQPNPRSIATKPLQFPIETLHWVSNGMRDFVLKMCAANPANRFATARDALNVLLAMEMKGPEAHVLPALSRKIMNAAETQLLLSRDTTKIVARRAYAVAIFMEAKTHPGAGELHISAETVTAALMDVRGEPVTIVRADTNIMPKPSAQSKIRYTEVAPTVRRFPFMETALAALVVGALGVMFYPRIKQLPFFTPPTAPVAAAKPVVKAMPNNLATSSRNYWLDRGDGPFFSWQNSVDGYDAFLHVSKAPNFSTLVVEVAVKGTQHKVMRELEEGKYFWRLWDRASGKVAGPFEITIAHLEPPKILTPSDLQTYTIANTYTSVVMDVSWVCKPGVGLYEVAISDQDGRLVAEEKTSECVIHSVQLASGQFNVKVRVAQPVGEMNNWSEPITFWVRGGRVDSLTRMRNQQKQNRQPARTRSR